MLKDLDCRTIARTHWRTISWSERFLKTPQQAGDTNLLSKIPRRKVTPITTFFPLRMWRSLFILVAHLALHVASQDFESCTTFTGGSIEVSQYQYYRFYDFRNMHRRNVTSSKSGHKQFKVVSDSSWEDDWYLRDYPRKSPGGYSIPVNFIPERVFIC